MVELVEGKKYKLVSLDPHDAYIKHNIIVPGSIMTYVKSTACCSYFKIPTRSTEIDLITRGLVVEEYIDPPKEAEAYTMIDNGPDLFNKISDIGRVEKRSFDTGAVRDTNEGKPFIHSLLGYTRQRFGYHMSKNAKKYGENNFLKGIPTNVYLESLDRHLAAYLEGDRSEDHLSAILFGVQGVMLNEQKDGIKSNHFYDI